MIVAQIIGLLGMAANIISFQFKSKKGILLCQLVGSALFTVNLFMLHAVMGGLANMIGIVRSLAYMKENASKRFRYLVAAVLMVLHVISYVCVFAVFQKEPTALNLIIEFLPLIGVGALMLGLCKNNAGAIRMAGCINSPCWLVYNVVNFAIGGILCEIFSLISILLAYARLDAKKKHYSEDPKRSTSK